MKNFDKVTENLKIEDFFCEGGTYAKWAPFLCKAIHKLKKEKNCANRDCRECYKWLQQEYKEPILDDVEREYLSAVIKPFRDKVTSIYKLNSNEHKEYILINLEDDFTNMPYFEAGTMYKGMETGKRYTLEELGL